MTKADSIISLAESLASLGKYNEAWSLLDNYSPEEDEKFRMGMLKARIGIQTNKLDKAEASIDELRDLQLNESQSEEFAEFESHLKQMKKGRSAGRVFTAIKVISVLVIVVLVFLGGYFMGQGESNRQIQASQTRQLIEKVDVINRTLMDNQKEIKSLKEMNSHFEEKFQLAEEEHSEAIRILSEALAPYLKISISDIKNSISKIANQLSVTDQKMHEAITRLETKLTTAIDKEEETGEKP